MLVGFKHIAEHFIADNVVVYGTRAVTPPKVFLVKYLGKGAKFALSMVAGVIASLKSYSDACVILCIWLFVPEMSFLESSCLGLPLSDDIS